MQARRITNLIKRHVHARDASLDCRAADLPPLNRTISVGYGALDAPDSPTIFQLGDAGKLSWIEPGGEWQVDEERVFLIAPVVTAITETERIAVALDGDANLVYSQYADGAWDFENGWLPLDLAAANRPTAISIAPGTLEVFTIDAAGQLHSITLTDGTWGEPESFGGGEFVGEVAVTFAGSRTDLFATTGYTIMHISRGPDGWLDEWEEIGHPGDNGPVFSPLAVSFEGTNENGESVVQIDLVSINLGTATEHRLYGPNGEWGNWTILPASHEGYEFQDAQTIVQGDATTPGYLFSRGTDDCIHYNSFNGTHWQSWGYIWCHTYDSSLEDYPTQYLPLTAIISADLSKIELVAENVTREALFLDLDVPVTIDSRDDDVPWVNLGA